MTFPTKPKTIAAFLSMMLVCYGIGELAHLASADQPGRGDKPRREYKALKRLDIEKLAPGTSKDDDSSQGMNEARLTQGLNNLGGDGWELMAIEPYHQISYHDVGGTLVTLHYHPTYVFRRSK
jgi:hypothetical protein